MEPGSKTVSRRTGPGRARFHLATFLADRHGGTAIEYGLIAAILFGALILVLTEVAKENTAIYTNIKNAYHKASQGG